METLTAPIRNTVRAIIIQNQHVLLLKKDSKERGEHYALPGGAQEIGETLEQALVRECIEEINTPVKVAQLVHVADFFKPKTIPEPHIIHQLEILFLCSVPDNYQPQNGVHPDKNQLSVDWVDLVSLNNAVFSPLFLSEFLAAFLKTDFPKVYLGLVS